MLYYNFYQMMHTFQCFIPRENKYIYFFDKHCRTDSFNKLQPPNLYKSYQNIRGQLCLTVSKIKYDKKFQTVANKYVKKHLI